MEQTRKERLGEACDFLRDKGIIRTQGDLAARLNMDAGNLSKALKGDVRYITDKFLKRFNAGFDNIFSMDWLLYGEGERFAEKDVQSEMAKQMKRGAPYYNIDFSDLPQDLSEVEPDYDINFKPMNTATLWCNVKGDSMSPLINNGDYVALREIVNTNFIVYGETYAIMTKGGLNIIRKITKSDTEGMVTLIPHNQSEEFAAQDIPTELIEKLYIVIGTIRKL